MKDMSSLQIDPRCIKCGQLSSKDVVLYEMRNHLFICTACRQEAEGHGKQIAWVDTTHQKTTTTTILEPRKTKVLTPALPPDSLFASLKLSLDTPIEEIESTIQEKMKYWTRAGNSQERKKMLEQLHEWQENIEDVDAFEEYRTSLKPKRKGNALSVGGRSVLSAVEFVTACEASKEGWVDGERYLRKGQLKQWVLFQLQAKALANDIGRYQAWSGVSDFRALNETLYRLNADRPFRLYQKEEWQLLATVASASTPQELASLCDRYWQSGEKHLYEGAMVFWLEYCQQIKDIRAYYNASVQVYHQTMHTRGVGLELLLERAVPTLTKPQLRITFDGTENAYTLAKWDRELPHQPVKVAITNTTRGFTYFRLKTNQGPTTLASLASNWLTLGPSDPFFVAGRPGNNMRATAQLSLQNLKYLQRGTQYQRTLTMEMLGENGVYTAPRTFPITIRTMSFFQGLRGKLWQWGLRGGLPGLFWNGCAATLISFILLTIVPLLIPASWETNVQPSGNLTVPLIIQDALLGVKWLLAFLHTNFVLMNTVIIGIAGFVAGLDKGHVDYNARMGARQFRKWTNWLSLIAVVVLSIWTRDIIYIGQWIGRGNATGWLAVIPYILMWLLLFIIAQVMIIIRNRLEKYLRARFDGLLKVPGRG